MLKNFLAKIKANAPTELDYLFGGIRRLHATKNEPASRKALFPLVDRLVTMTGFLLYNQSLSWINDREFNQLWKNSPYEGKQRIDRKFVVYSALKSITSIQGDTAECGVLDGASSYIILDQNKGFGKHHYMFDSWQGLSEPDAVDKEVPPDSSFKWKAGDLAVDLNECKKNLEQFHNKKFFQGWIPDQFHNIAEKTFSFVHIDVDLYQPTLESLKFFWPRIQKGGILLCDDYGFESCPGARRACDEFFSAQCVPVCMVHLPTGQGIITK
jgi:O-methyltransferase